MSQINGSDEFEYKAWIEGLYPKEEFPNDYILVLKDGARVMFIANDNTHGRYTNGTLGTVTYCDDEYITVKTDDGYSVDVKKFRPVRLKSPIFTTFL